MRAQSKRAETELEEARQNAARVEAEKAVLEERVEVEGAERVTVVASVSHERDFLLRQARTRIKIFSTSHHISRYILPAGTGSRVLVSWGASKNYDTPNAAYSHRC